MTPATVPDTYGPYGYVSRLCERLRGRGPYGIANSLRDEESSYAGLAVKSMQTRGLDDAAFFLEQSALLRAVRYEFAATGDVLRELQGERLVELRRRTGRQ